uniref:G protein-coupled receptor n=1 Tax=Caenorhabditis tropicalis TaxID=1561998 RepID=A0A1I7T6I5_9PELO
MESKIFFPSASICSNGFLAEYSVISFQIFVILLGFTGMTAVLLFIYRMKAVSQHVERATFRRVIVIMSYIFYGSLIIVNFFCVLTYTDLKDQDDYKKLIEQKRGALPDFVWCDNCFFIRLDSSFISTFFIFAYVSLTSAFVAGVLAAIETFRSLNNKSFRLSAKTAAVQRNLTYSLVIMTSVHIGLIFIPLLIFFVANFVVINNQTLPILMIIMIQDHGLISTFAMILTNNLLRKSTRDLLNGRFCSSIERKSEPASGGNVQKSLVFRIRVSQQ